MKATSSNTLEAFIRDLLSTTPEPELECLATVTPAELAELRLELALIVERRQRQIAARSRSQGRG